MQESTLNQFENLFMALSDKTRLRLLTLMANGEVSVGYLADTLGESQPKISRHLAYLRNAGLASTRRDGKWVYYGIEPTVSPVTATLMTALNTLNGTELSAHAAQGDNDETNISDQAYINEWEPNEMEVYLL